METDDTKPLVWISIVSSANGQSGITSTVKTYDSCNRIVNRVVSSEN